MTFDEYFSRGVPKVNAPNVFRTSDGQYVNDQDQPLRVINNSLSDNPAMWTYQDELGKIYTPKITTTVQNGYISDLGGKPNNDTPLYKKNPTSYFHPIYGAPERWKASMSNETNPFIGLGRTFGRAGELYMGGAMAKLGYGALKTISNASNFGKGLYELHRFVSPFIKGSIGAKGVDLASEKTTGKTWAQNVAPWLGMSEGTAELTNPGMLFGAVRTGIADKIARNTRKDQFKNNMQAEMKAFYDRAMDARRKYDNAFDLFATAHDDLNNTIDPHLRNVVARVATARRKNAQYNHRLLNPIPKEDLETEVLIQPYNGVGDLLERPKVSFTDEVGKTYTDQLAPTIGNSVQYRANTLHGVSQRQNSKTVSDLYDRYSDNIPQKISQYVDRLNDRMGDDGAVAGSLIHYKNKVFPVTESNGMLLGPADTEIYTTQARLPALQQKLNFKQSRTNSVGGLKGTSEYTFRNTDSAHNGVDTEINVIQADKNGNAVGKLAHQIYRSLHPEEYSKFAYDYAMAGNTKPFYEQKLPVSAEDLFQTINKNPDLMQRSLFADMFGMETFTRPQNIKANKRLFQALFNEDTNVQQMFNQAMLDNGKANMGSRFTLGTDIYNNMQFSNTEANTEFLEHAFRLPKNIAQRFAKNEGVMRNAVNLYNQSYSTGVRLVGNDVVSAKTRDGVPIHDAKLELFDGNASFSGGNFSGGGLNRALLNPEGGWNIGGGNSSSRNLVSITQSPLTYHPEKIKTPMDLFNNVKRIQEVDPNKINPNSVATFNDEGPVKYNRNIMDSVSRQALEQDLPVNFYMGRYGFGYSGSYGKPIASGLRFVSNQSEGVELGSLLREIYNHKTNNGTWHNVDVYDIPPNVLEAISNASDAKRDAAIKYYNEMSPKDKRLTNDQFSRQWQINNEFKKRAEFADSKLVSRSIVRGNTPLSEMSPLLYKQYKNAVTPKGIYLDREHNVIPNQDLAKSDQAKEIQRKITQFYKDYKQSRRDYYKKQGKVKKLEHETHRLYDQIEHMQNMELIVESNLNKRYDKYFQKNITPSIDSRIVKLIRPKIKTFKKLLTNTTNKNEKSNEAKK